MFENNFKKRNVPKEEKWTAEAEAEMERALAVIIKCVEIRKAEYLKKTNRD